MNYDERVCERPQVIHPVPAPQGLTADGQLSSDEPKLGVLFGFGRRRSMPRAGLRYPYAMTHTLATFNITKPLDGDSNFVAPSEEYRSGNLRCVRESSVFC